MTDECQHDNYKTSGEGDCIIALLAQTGGMHYGDRPLETMPKPHGMAPPVDFTGAGVGVVLVLVLMICAVAATATKLRRRRG